MERRRRLQRFRRGSVLRHALTDAERPQREAVPRGEDLADAAAVADLPIGFVADEAGRRRRCDRGELLQGKLGLGGRELGIDDRPEALPVPPLLCLAAFRRRARRPQMDIAHSGRLDGGLQLALREAGTARQRQIAHVDECRDAGAAERGDKIGERGLLVADEIKRLAHGRQTPALARMTTDMPRAARFASAFWYECGRLPGNATTPPTPRPYRSPPTPML